MMFSLESTLRNLRSLRPARRGAAGKRSKRERFSTFEFLEERWCPSTTDIWIGGATGSYNNSANWSLGVVPYNGNLVNGQPTTFTVQIGNASVTMDNISPTIDNLTIADNASALHIANGQSLTVVNSGSGTGTINNIGTIALDSTGGGTALDASGNVTLTGGGTVTMSNSSGSRISETTSNSTLTNVDNMIQGQGTITGLNFINQGTVDATVPGGTATALYIQSAPTTNTGTLQATGGGTLYFQSSSVTNTNGTISTDGSSSSVILSSSGVLGGNLTSTNGAVIHGANNSALAGVTITSGSTLSVDPGANFYLSGDLINHGKVVIGLGISGGGGNLIVNASTVNLSGGGTVILNNALSHLEGNTSTDTLVNRDNTIQGQGIISGLNFINQATVDANVLGGTATALNIESPTTTNTGTLEATGGGTLYLQSSSVTNTNGTISTDGSSPVILNSSAIIGGNLTSAGTAEIHTISNTLLDNVTITSGSTLSVDAGSNINFQGDLVNHGTIVVAGIFVAYNSTVNLSGGGIVNLTGGSLVGATSSDALVNVDNTIQGQGAISVPLTNGATVNANVANGTLNIQFDPSVTNTGTLEATGGGTLNFLGSSVTNTNGTISTDGSSTVTSNSSGVLGGNLTSPIGAAIHAISNSLFDGVTVTSGSTFSLDSGEINFTGNLINKGTIVIGGNGNLTAYNSNVTLTGGGKVILSSPSSFIQGNANLSPLVNKDNTIEGQGNIRVDLINQGTVNANVQGGTLTIIVNNTANLGMMEATGGGTLDLQAASPFGSTVNNTNGTISTDSSSSVILSLTEVLGGYLTSVGSAEIHANSSALDGATITSGSTYSLDGDTNTSVTGDLINNGTVVIGPYSGNAPPPNLVYYVGTATLSGGGIVDAGITSGVGGTFLTNLGNTIPNLGAGTGMIVLNASDAAPTATTQVATDVTGTSATLNGGVNPEGSDTLVHFVYGTDSTLTTGTSTTPAQDIGNGTSDVALTAAISSLTPGKTYYYEVVATNSLGTTDGQIISFTTPAPAVATTQAASNVTSTTATLNGSVNPEGNETTVSFVYGTDPNLASGTTTTAPQAIASVGTAQPVTAAISGLQPGTTYSYEVVAQSTGGTVHGLILNFTTAPSAPLATTQPATGATATTAMLNGSVNPEGSAHHDQLHLRH